MKETILFVLAAAIPLLFIKSMGLFNVIAMYAIGVVAVFVLIWILSVLKKSNR